MCLVPSDPAPVMVSGKVPVCALPPALIVSVELTPPEVGVMGFGLKLAVAPEGRPDTARVTGTLYPLTEVMPTANLVRDPRETVREEGLADIEKSEVVDLTVRVTPVLWIVPSVPVPVIVRP